MATKKKTKITVKTLTEKDITKLENIDTISKTTGDQWRERIASPSGDFSDENELRKYTDSYLTDISTEELQDNALLSGKDITRLILKRDT